jgi:hypothetical protein
VALPRPPAATQEKLQQFTKGRIKKELQVTPPPPRDDHGSAARPHHGGRA